MAYTEFYTDYVSGNNMNGGSDAGSATVTYTNGGWNSGTGVFTPASGNPSSAGVTVGQFASVYADGGTTPAFVGRIPGTSPIIIAGGHNDVPHDAAVIDHIVDVVNKL